MDGWQTQNEMLAGCCQNLVTQREEVEQTS